jgi:hypothetical protein
MKDKRVLFFIVISIAFPIMMFSCSGGGIGDIDLTHLTPVPGTIPQPGPTVPGPVPQLPPTSNAWIIETVDNEGAVGNYNSIAIDSSGKVHISYSGEGNADIKYATNSSGSWLGETVVSGGNVGGISSIATDSLDKVHISYTANAALLYATNSSGSWVSETVDSGESEGDSNSITIDSSGKVHISYSGEGNAALKYAVKQ